MSTENQTNSSAENQTISIDTATYTPADFANKSIRFKIPLYQRLFTWDTEQINELLNDLFEYFKSQDGTGIKLPYYLGIITVMPDKDEYYLVIDGQQRLTVLMLMGMVFEGLYPDSGWASFLCPVKKDYKDIAIPENSADMLDWKLRLLPFAREDDKRSLLELLVLLREGKDPNNIPSENISPLMLGAVKSIYNFMKDKENLPDFSGENFAKTIYDHLTFFATSLSPSYREKQNYLNKYFEIMNSHYKNLEQPEILKVKLLTDQKDKSVKNYLLELWGRCENFSIPLYSPVSGKDNEEKASCNNFADYFKNAKKREKKGSQSDNTPQNDSPAADNEKSLKELCSITAKRSVQKQSRVPGERSIINFSQFLLLALAMFLERTEKDSICHASEKPSSLDKNAPSAAFTESDEANRKCYNTSHLLEIFGLPGELIISANDIPRFYFFLFQIRALLDFYVIRRANDLEDTYMVMCGEVKDEKKGDKTTWDPKYPGCRLAQYQAMLDVAFPEYFYKWLKPYLTWLYDLNFDAQGKLKKESAQPLTRDDLLQLLNWLKDWDNRHALDCTDYDDDKIRESAINDKLSPDKLKYGKVDRYWFWRLDYYLWEKTANSSGNDAPDKGNKFFETNQLDAVQAYRMRMNRSIEHLFPQNPGNQIADWIKEDTLNSFGNLAMISSSFNSTQGNDAVRVKFARVEIQMERRALQSLKLLVMYNVYKGQQPESWASTLAKEHGEKMIKMLKDSFEQIVAPLQNGSDQQS